MAEPILVGVKHKLWFLKYAKKLLKGIPGKTIALEIDKAELRLFEQIAAMNPISRWIRLRRLYPDKRFFYHLTVFAKKKGLEVIPIDSRYAKEKIRKSKGKLRRLIIAPARENHFMYMIRKTKPDIVVLGDDHLKISMQMYFPRVIAPEDYAPKKEIRKRAPAIALPDLYRKEREEYLQRKQQRQRMRRHRLA